MILLPRAFEQRLIGRVLNQGALEEIACLLANAAVIENLRFHQFRQGSLQVGLTNGCNGVEQFVGKLSSQRRSELGNLSRSGQAIQPSKQRFLQGGWDC